MAVKILDRPGIGGNLFGKVRFHGLYGSEILLAADDREMKVAPSFYAGHISYLDLPGLRLDTRTRYFEPVGPVGGNGV